MRVLIVDDNASIRALLSSLLCSRGHTVVDALADGSRVMECINEHAPDIVCLDYEMPGRNGLQIMREINATTPQVDVVFITASEDPGLRQKAADLGAAGFVNKPVGQRQLIEELDQVYAARRRALAASERAETSPLPDATTVAVEAHLPTIAAPVAGPQTPETPIHRDPHSIIIADDNGSIRLLLKGLLTELGFKVVQACSNGADAVAAVKEHRPAVVCLDVDMPVMTGLEALPLIREASPETAVVMVTANNSREFVTQAATGGAKGYIVKPIRPKYVEEFMRKLVK